MIGDTRCSNPSKWYISYDCINGGCCVCDTHKEVVLATSDIAKPVVLQINDLVLATYVANRENRWRCQWDTSLHEEK